MSTKMIAMAGALAAAAGACAFGQMSGTTTGGSSAPSRMDVRFMKTLAQGNTAEIKLGKLALTKTRDTQVHNVATTIVQDHTQAGAALMQIAQRQGVTLPTHMDAKHQALYAKLSGMSGMAFNKTYIAGQVKDHVKTVALINHEQSMTQDAPLMRFIAVTFPKIKGHTAELKQVNTRLASGNTTMQGGLKDNMKPVGGIKPAGM